MAEYINREDVREMMRMEFDDDYADEAVDRLPAADVAPVRHGRWIEAGSYQICSECGEEHAWDEYRATYCEDCGARMDGGDEDAL